VILIILLLVLLVELKKNTITIKELNKKNFAIHPEVRSIIEQIAKKGSEAYIVGGGTRDVILNSTPTDFDIITTATLRDIKAIFSKNCIIVGKRHRIALVRIKGITFEVSSIHRKYHGKLHNIAVKLRLRPDTIFSDAYKRDFTCNAIYINPITKSFYDFFSGLEDIKNKTIRIIGSPNEKIKNDPIRIMRALRFHVKTKFVIEKYLKLAILKNIHLLQDVSKERLYLEFQKLFNQSCTLDAFNRLIEYKIFTQLFPTVDLSNELEIEFLRQLFYQADKRTVHAQRNSYAFIFSCILWHSYSDAFSDIRSTNQDIEYKQQHKDACIYIFNLQNSTGLRIPYKTQITIRKIWDIQNMLENEKCNVDNKQILLKHKFKISYHLLVLRNKYYSDLSLQTKFWNKIVSKYNL
jgi:poly(A) polymerase